MSFFELDGGGKAKARKSTKPKATKKAPVKKSSGKKKTSGKKKGGNFLGTVSELFAPAGWENFVTAAGLLALDRTDNYLRKNKDSKKQHGGTDGEEQHQEEQHQEEMESFTSRMRGGSRKRSSSRKQRGGSDGHHTVETLDMLTTGGEEPEMTGGAKSRRGRKQRGGAMTEEQQAALYNVYLNLISENKNSNNATKYEAFIISLLQHPDVNIEVNPENIQEAKLVIDLKKAQSLLNNNATKLTMINSANRALKAFLNPQLVPAGNNSLIGQNNSLNGQNNSLNGPAPLTGSIFNSPNSNTAKALQQANIEGGKPKSSTKKAPKKKAPTKKKAAPKKK